MVSLFISLPIVGPFWVIELLYMFFCCYSFLQPIYIQGSHTFLHTVKFIDSSICVVNAEKNVYFQLLWMPLLRASSTLTIET